MHSTRYAPDRAAFSGRPALLRLDLKQRNSKNRIVVPKYALAVAREFGASQKESVDGRASQRLDCDCGKRGRRRPDRRELAARSGKCSGMAGPFVAHGRSAD